MPTVYDGDSERPATLEEVAFARSLADARRYRLLSRSIRRQALGRYSELRFASSLPGDRTDNTPPLRKDAKVRNTLDLTAYPYLLEPNGVCVQLAPNGDIDLERTLAVLTHYRYILASR